MSSQLRSPFVKKFAQAQAGIGAALLLFGVMVLFGWALRNVVMIRLLPGFHGMVFSTAAGFTLIGFGLLLPALGVRRASFAQTAIGWALLLGAGLILMENLVDRNFGLDFPSLHTWIDPYNIRPGRMAANTSIGMMFCGFALLLMQHVTSRARGFALQVATFAVFAVGVAGVVGHSLDLEMLYSGFRSVRMAPQTAIGMILAGVGLWLNWYPAEWYRSRRYFEEDEKVSFAGAAALVVVALTAGIAAFAAQQRAIEQTVNENLATTLKRRVGLFNTVVRHSLADVDAMAKRADLVRVMRLIRDNPDNQDALAQLFEIATSILNPHVSGISIVGANNREVMELGEFTDTPEITAELHEPVLATVSWRDALYLNSRSRIMDGNEVIGYLVAEQPLSILTEQLAKQEGVGKTGSIAMCVPQPGHFRCLPFFPNSNSQQIPRYNPLGQALPMNYAVAGGSGIFKGPDYKGRNVIAVYGPVTGSSFGIVVKQETEELYRSMRDQLELTVPLLVIFVLISAWLLRFHVKPLATKLLNSEREALEALAGVQASQERIRTIIESAQDAFIGMDLRGNITDWNSQAEKMFGWSTAEAIGRSFVKTVIPERLQDNYNAVLHRFNETGKIDYLDQRLERTVVNCKGEEFPVELMVALAGTNESYFFSAFIRDISERKRVERMKDEFISTVSHELRTPLTSIRGSLGLLTGGAAGEFSPMAKGLLDIANANCERLVRMISGILDIEKIESGNMQFDMTRQPLLPLVRQAIDATQGYAEQFNVNLTLWAPARDILVTVDRDRMTQVVVNLLSNAVKFSPAGANVEVRIHAKPDKVRLSVVDHGVGVPEKFREHIFQKFAQADASDSRQKGGTGLGLSICKSIVEEHGGRIDFESEVGVGSEFYVDLRIAA
jgi:PAS domain S-box-containing protein